jgi:hypothetical protein
MGIRFKKEILIWFVTARICQILAAVTLLQMLCTSSLLTEGFLILAVAPM